MKISKGMYIRTKYGISRIVEFRERKNDLSCYYLDKNIMGEEKYLSNCIYDYKYYTDQILKASFNLIDLIEVGDYVNGYKVSEIIIDKDISDNDKLKFGDDDMVLTFKSNHDTYYLYIEDIEDVITKEQFNSMKYVVERNTNENL